jgi:hypothetical protein
MSEVYARQDGAPYVDIPWCEWVLRPEARLEVGTGAVYTTGTVLPCRWRGMEELFLRIERAEVEPVTLTFGWYELVAMLRVLTRLLGYAEFEEDNR